MKGGQFSCLNIGDLLFWGSSPIPPVQTDQSKNEGFSRAVSAAGGDQAPFHVAMIAGIDRSQPADQTGQSLSIDLIHATSHGVIREKFHEYCAHQLETYPSLEVTHCAIEAPNVTDPIKTRALDFAISKIGCEYNYIFAENCRNSMGNEAYYCCQLIRKSYEHALGVQEGNKLFNVHPLNFRMANGSVIEYWNKYFKERNMDIPEHELGSNPASLMKSGCIRKVEKIIVQGQ